MSKLLFKPGDVIRDGNQNERIILMAEPEDKGYFFLHKNWFEDRHRYNPTNGYGRKHYMEQKYQKVGEVKDIEVLRTQVEFVMASFAKSFAIESELLDDIKINYEQNT